MLLHFLRKFFNELSFESYSQAHTHTNRHTKMILKRKMTGGCFSGLLFLVLSPWFLLNKGAMQFRSIPALESPGIRSKSWSSKSRQAASRDSLQKGLQGSYWATFQPFSPSLSMSCKPWNALARKSFQVAHRQCLKCTKSCQVQLQA